jgi:hypothetical protein
MFTPSVVPAIDTPHFISGRHTKEFQAGQCVAAEAAKRAAGEQVGGTSSEPDHRDSCGTDCEEHRSLAAALEKALGTGLVHQGYAMQFDGRLPVEAPALYEAGLDLRL